MQMKSGRSLLFLPFLDSVLLKISFSVHVNVILACLRTADCERCPHRSGCPYLVMMIFSFSVYYGTLGCLMTCWKYCTVPMPPFCFRLAISFARLPSDLIIADLILPSLRFWQSARAMNPFEDLSKDFSCDIDLRFFSYDECTDTPLELRENTSHWFLQGQPQGSLSC